MARTSLLDPRSCHQLTRLDVCAMNRFVLVQFIEIGGDHLDSLMSADKEVHTHNHANDKQARWNSRACAGRRHIARNARHSRPVRGATHPSAKDNLLHQRRHPIRGGPFLAALQRSLCSD